MPTSWPTWAACARRQGRRSPCSSASPPRPSNLLENARAKLTKKAVDAIVLNDVSRAGIGFNSDRNEVTIVTANDTIAIPEASKLDVACKILEAVLRLRKTLVNLL